MRGIGDISPEIQGGAKCAERDLLTQCLHEKTGARPVLSFYPCFTGRGDRIRTCDLYVPNVALYQTELHPD